MLAAHLIFGAHGFWLPNDPRGSWSQYIRSYEIYFAGGRATTTSQRHSLAADAHNRALRLRTKAALRYPAVQFSSEQARAIVRGFKQAVTESNYGLLALATMVDHVHAVIEPHENSLTRIAGHFKARATQALLDAKLHPFAEHVRPNGRIPDVWVQHGWKVYLDTPDDVRRAILYVRDNPIKAGMRPQRYSFLKPFESA